VDGEVHRWLLAASFWCLLIAAPELVITPALAQQTTGTPDALLIMTDDDFGAPGTLGGFIIFVIGGLVGTGFGVALGFFIFPHVFPSPPASETISPAEHSLVATGTFIHANPSDPIAKLIAPILTAARDKNGGLEKTGVGRTRECIERPAWARSRHQ